MVCRWAVKKVACWDVDCWQCAAEQVSEHLGWATCLARSNGRRFRNADRVALGRKFWSFGDGCM